MTVLVVLNSHVVTGEILDPRLAASSLICSPIIICIYK